MLNLQNICFDVYDGKEKISILDNLSLNVEAQKFTVVTGPNGSGKSTLARIIAGIEKPTAGSVSFFGEDITNKTITERANLGISFAFQQPVKFKGIKVIDLLRFAAKKNLTHSEACDYLAEVGLCARDYVDREVNGSLSGGELKRIEIASVMARGAKLTIFDEPEAGIDLWSFQNLIRIFENMRKNIKDSAILIISHQERILEIADEIVVVKNGKIEKQGAGNVMLKEILASGEAKTNCGKLLGKEAK
ncbi:MAG: ATP-binding cassette domain-containing protein [Selenomonadaceae bacterium]|nr:ATP-binding cassette domain-containing protein [Selenomonadaceae bacterium]